MEKFLIVAGGAGVVCTLAALVGLGIASASNKHWGIAVTCLGAFAVIMFLLLVGLEYQSTFWEGK